MKRPRCWNWTSKREQSAMGLHRGAWGITREATCQAFLSITLTENFLVGPTWARTNALYAAYPWWDTSRMEPWCRLNPAHSVGHTMIMIEVKIPGKPGIKNLAGILGRRPEKIPGKRVLLFLPVSARGCDPLACGIFPYVPRNEVTVTHFVKQANPPKKGKYEKQHRRITHGYRPWPCG
jgi:hypothetical protein